MIVLSLLSLALLGVVAVVDGSPVLQIRDSPISVPIAVRVNTTGGVRGLIIADRARISRIRTQAVQRRRARELGTRNVDLVGAINSGVSYACEVGVGNPPTSYTLLIDTGSSNTWIGAGKPFKITNDTQVTSNEVSVTYGSGSFSGEEYTDTVTIGDATIQRQSIGVASMSEGFSDIDGILGLGPEDLTIGTLNPNALQAIPTVTQNLKLQGLISTTSVGISFQPTVNLNQSNGELDFGGVDPSKFTGSIHTVSVTDVPESSLYWGITQTISYGGETITDPLLPPSGIIDTGTTLLFLPTVAFGNYVNTVGATLDSETGLLKITEEQFNNLQSLFFTIGDATFEFTANAQIWPRSLNEFIGGRAEAIYLIVADFDEVGTVGIDFINGFSWLQRFYTLFDTENNQIGFATTPFTYASTN